MLVPPSRPLSRLSLFALTHSPALDFPYFPSASNLTELIHATSAFYMTDSVVRGGESGGESIQDNAEFGRSIAL